MEHYAFSSLFEYNCICLMNLYFLSKLQSYHLAVHARVYVQCKRSMHIYLLPASHRLVGEELATPSSEQ